MAVYNLFLKEVTVNEWTVEGGGTALEAIGKETVEPTNPSTTKFLKVITSAKKAEAKLTLPAALSTELNAGAKVIALTVHASALTATAGKRLKFGTVSPAVTSEPSLTLSQAWYTVSFTKAQAEEQTKATLEALTLLAEKLLTASVSLYEIYATVTTEAAGGGVVGKAAGPLILDGKATGTAVQVVSGKATGPLLLTGTSTGTAAQRVSGKATGPLLLTGTSKGTAVQVVQGKAAGTLFLTGSATAKGGEVVVGKASGALLLLGSAKGTAVQVVAGKATGTVLLTGTATGTAAQQVIGRATGVLRLTGRATAAGGAVTKRNVIFIFEE